MDFKRLKNDNSNCDVPYYELPNGDNWLKDERSIHNYELYQRKYKQVCGVMPELDRIHNPVCAVNAKKVFLPDDLQEAQRKNTGKAAIKGLGDMFVAADALTSGSIGGFFANLANGSIKGAASLYGREHFGEFISEYKRAMSKYEFAYSLICSYDLGFIDNLPCGEHLSMDNLGYKKTEDGTYYEGTWQNVEHLYGLVCAGNGSFVFLGTFDSEGNPDEGVMNDGQIKMGLFKNFELNCMHGVCISENYFNGDTHIECSVDVGGFEDDRRNGTIITFVKHTNDQIILFKGEYDYGEEIKKDTFNKGKLESIAGGLFSKFFK